MDRCTCHEQYFRENKWCQFCVETGRDKEVARQIADMNIRTMRAHWDRQTGY
jgi:hypothetical protein